VFSERDGEGRPVAYNHVAGLVATGNSDGAKHVIGEMTAALVEAGFTVPGQAWAYFNNGSAAGPTYLESPSGKQKRSHLMARIAASDLSQAARALAANPISKPPEGGL
jgi:hypothetical protein